jgi:hypothetical protein
VTIPSLVAALLFPNNALGLTPVPPIPVTAQANVPSRTNVSSLLHKSVRFLSVMELLVLSHQNVKLLELILLLVYPKSVIQLMEIVVLFKLVAMMQILVLLILVIQLMVSAHILPNAPPPPISATPSLVIQQPAIVKLLLWSVLHQVVVLKRPVIQSRDAFLLSTNLFASQSTLVFWVLARLKEFVLILPEIVPRNNRPMLLFLPVSIIHVFLFLDVNQFLSIVTKIFQSKMAPAKLSNVIT